MVTICHMAAVIGSRFWLTLHGAANSPRNLAGSEIALLMTECASHVQWKMLLVKFLTTAKSVEKMGTAVKF